MLTSKPYALEFFKPLSMTRSSPKSSPSPLCLFLITCLFLSSWNALCFSPQPLSKKEKIKNEADCSNSWRANNARVHTAIHRSIILPCAGQESQKTQSTINQRDQSNSKLCVRNLLLNLAVLQTWENKEAFSSPCGSLHAFLFAFIVNMSLAFKVVPETCH